MQSGPHTPDEPFHDPAENSASEVLRLRGGAGGLSGDGTSGPCGDCTSEPGGDGAGGPGGNGAGGPGGDSMLAAARGTTSALNLSQVQTSIIVF